MSLGCFICGEHSWPGVTERGFSDQLYKSLTAPQRSLICACPFAAQPQGCGNPSLSAVLLPLPGATSRLYNPSISSSTQHVRVTAPCSLQHFSQTLMSFYLQSLLLHTSLVVVAIFSELYMYKMRKPIAYYSHVA